MHVILLESKQIVSRIMQSTLINMFLLENDAVESGKGLDWLTRLHIALNAAQGKFHTHGSFGYYCI